MSITFTRTTQSRDATTGVVTPTTSTITANAVEVRPNITRYQALGLSLTSMPTLLVTPTTYGDLPQPGDTVTWPATNGDLYTVKDVSRVAPDGVTIIARVVIGR